MKNKLIRLIASCFYLGYAPFAPGTFGSLFGVGVYLLVKDNLYFYFFALGLISILGLGVSSNAEIIFGFKDSQRIVIDEATGMLISLLSLPYKGWIMWSAFFLFRFFDVVKPYPIRRLQKLKGSLGVMFDDILAGIYTNILLQILLRLLIYSTTMNS